MRRLVLALAISVAGLLAGNATPAEAPARTVSMPAKLYDPETLDVLVGTTVTWKNDDSTNHTVTADGDAFSSGYVPPGGSFSFTFTAQGRYAFHCTIHKFMRGEVSVFGLVLSGPENAVTAGRRVVLAGLAPPGTAEVTVRGTAAPITVHPRPDGSFALRFAVSAPGSYRATADRLSSPPVRIATRPVIRIAKAGHVISAVATPPRPGATARLQSYDRERFDWVTIGRTKLDAASRARLHAPKGIDRVRVLVEGSKGWADGASPTLRLDGGSTTGGVASSRPHIGSHAG